MNFVFLPKETSTLYLLQDMCSRTVSIHYVFFFCKNWTTCQQLHSHNGLFPRSSFLCVNFNCTTYITVHIYSYYWGENLLIYIIFMKQNYFLVTTIPMIGIVGRYEVICIFSPFSSLKCYTTQLHTVSIIWIGFINVNGAVVGMF